MKTPIPIVLLHHSQVQVLLATVESITKFTKHPYVLFVIDNLSPKSPELISAFSDIESKYNGIIIFNKKNNWIRGFNLALKHSSWPKSKYYAFSDADIIVPNLGSECWLEKMVEQMNMHRCIGKLGLNLDLGNLKKNPKLQKSYEAELRLLKGETIGTNIIAGVDTTMALYRDDFFVSDFKFRIGHQSLQKPYYYICRTSAKLSAIHVGWDFYPGAGEKSYSVEKHWSKAWTMCKMGTYVAPEIMMEFGILRRCQLRFAQYSIKMLHFFKVFGMISWYVIKHLPRKINEIQSRVR